MRKGGVDGLLKAIDSNHTATCIYSSGLQVSGTFTEVVIKAEVPVYTRTEGPTTLNFKDKQLEGHGKEYHREGFGSPAGKLKDTDKPLEMHSDGDLEALGIKTGADATLEFESGVIVTGKLENILRREGRILLMTFTGCNVRFRDRILFDPSWGTYDMAVGEKIVSAYPGPADPDAFGLEYPVPKEKTHKILHSDRARKLHQHYQSVRKFRENGDSDIDLNQIWSEVKQHYPEEWLVPMEILELINNDAKNAALKDEIMQYLKEVKSQDLNTKRLIDNGLLLLK